MSRSAGTGGTAMRGCRCDRRRALLSGGGGMTATVELGQIDVPSGVLLVLDPGLGRFWRHEEEPRSPRQGDPPCVDLAIVGPDATEAGYAFAAEVDPIHSTTSPLFLLDVPADSAVADRFAAFVAGRGLRARADVLPNGLPHADRARLAATVTAGA